MSFEPYHPPRLSKRVEYLPGGVYYDDDVNVKTNQSICINCGWAYGYHFGKTCPTTSHNDLSHTKDKRPDILIWLKPFVLNKKIKTL